MLYLHLQSDIHSSLDKSTSYGSKHNFNKKSKAHRENEGGVDRAISVCIVKKYSDFI